jgi:ABC-type multidrug transport system fused ATPase/permease subunit
MRQVDYTAASPVLVSLRLNPRHQSMSPLAWDSSVPSAASADSSAQGSDWWVAQWTRAAVESSSSAAAAAAATATGDVAAEAVVLGGAGWAASLGQRTSLGIYAASAAVVLLLAWLQGLAFGTVALRASRRLHDRALAAVLRATAAWFDSQPTGRILARFAGDIDGVDDALPSAAEQVGGW